MDKKIKLKKMFPKVSNFRKSLLKVGDMVKVISGNHKGEVGKIIDFDRKRGKVKISGINMKTHFIKKEQGREGGLVQSEGFIDVSNVMFFENDSVTRLRRNEEGKRISKKTNKEVGDAK